MSPGGDGEFQDRATRDLPGLRRLIAGADSGEIA